MELSYSDLTKWDRRFFQLCEVLASWSEDRSRKVGAVIVGSANQIISTGFNGLPRLVSNHDSRHGRKDQEKYYWFEHAERNALFNAARSGTSTDGCKMYSSLFPCSDCSRGIIQSGIIELSTFAPPASDETFNRSFDVSLEMLKEANITIRTFHPD
jgi:dCMP deaminase